MIDRARQILNAAATLFYERGFHNVGMDDIGRVVGITGPAIYRHFSSKDEILATLFNEAIDEIITRAEPHEDPHIELDRLILAQTEFAVTHTELVSIYTRDDRELTHPWRNLFLRRARRHEDHWVELLRKCYPDIEEARAVWAARAVLGMIHSTARWPKDPAEIAEVVELLGSMAKRALAVLDDPDVSPLVERPQDLSTA